MGRAPVTPFHSVSQIRMRVITNAFRLFTVHCTKSNIPGTGITPCCEGKHPFLLRKTRAPQQRTELCSSSERIYAIPLHARLSKGNPRGFTKQPERERISGDLKSIEDRKNRPYRRRVFRQIHDSLAGEIVIEYGPVLGNKARDRKPEAFRKVL